MYSARSNSRAIDLCKEITIVCEWRNTNNLQREIFCTEAQNKGGGVDSAQRFAQYSRCRVCGTVCKTVGTRHEYQSQFNARAGHGLSKTQRLGFRLLQSSVGVSFWSRVKAHQRIIRERKAMERGRDGLFGPWWDGIDTDINKATLREVDLRTAASIITEYEYLGTMPNAPIKAYAIVWEKAVGGVIVFGAVSPPSVAHSVMPDKYASKVIQLARGACVNWAHPHAASKLISFGLREIAKHGWRVAIAYADPDAGEIGTVYQATNWIYCGLTAKRPDYLRPDGSRWMGHMAAGVAETLETVPRTRKGRYVYIMGSHKERRELNAALQWPREQYPKRLETCHE